MVAGHLQALVEEGKKTGTPSGLEEGSDVCPAGLGVVKVRNLTVGFQVEVVGR